jgi:uncharacterized protein (UPF0335 family)
MKRIAVHKLKNFPDFESFCIDFFNTKFKVNDFKKWGKEGQKQDGIDLYSTEGKVIVECKSRIFNNLTEVELKKIIKDLKKHPFYTKSKKRIIATSRKKDTKLQLIAEKNNIEIYFWEDFEEDLCKPAYQSVLVGYWGYFPISKSISLINLKSSPYNLFLGQDKISGKNYFESRHLLCMFNNLEVNFLFLKKIIKSTSQFKRLLFLDKLKVNKKEFGLRTNVFPELFNYDKFYLNLHKKSRARGLTDYNNQELEKKEGLRFLKKMLTFLTKHKNSFFIIETSSSDNLSSVVNLIGDLEKELKKLNIQIILVFTGDKQSFNYHRGRQSLQIRDLKTKEADIENFRIKIL